VPVYKTVPDESEAFSLKQCIHILDKYDIILVLPYDLDLKYYTNILHNKARVERFEAKYFEGIQGYNQLVMSEMFYRRFKQYKYMLLYQLDAYIFNDDLSYWCKKGYDYVAPPWMDKSFVERYWTSNSRIGKWLKQLGVIPNSVGNGGFSLRKIKTCLLITRLFEVKTKKWDSNEDIFWSLYVPYYFPFFKIPRQSEALRFAFETEPAKCYEMTGNKLPMGCHAWEKHDPGFWKQFINYSHSE
jgi:hypothetical protein